MDQQSQYSRKDRGRAPWKESLFQFSMTIRERKNDSIGFFLPIIHRFFQLIFCPPKTVLQCVEGGRGPNDPSLSPIRASMTSNFERFALLPKYVCMKLRCVQLIQYVPGETCNLSSTTFVSCLHHGKAPLQAPCRPCVGLVHYGG